MTEARRYRSGWWSTVLVVVTLVVTYFGGYFWVRHWYHNLLWMADPYEGDSITCFPEEFWHTRTLYYAYWPVCEIDEMATGREYKLDYWGP